VTAFSLEHLTPTEFEEFVYGLLVELRMTNVQWRKGTPLASSPADQGRDIEATLSRRDFDQREFLERWFVECKTYERGVPPTALENALTWAEAEQPKHLVFAVAGFLSNGAKQFLETYQRTRAPRFSVRTWELPDLERLSAGMTTLRRKFKIGGELPHLDRLHPAHAEYLRSIRPNSLSYLFGLLNELESEWKDNDLYFVSMLVVHPRHRQPRFRDERPVDLLLDPVDYEAFRAKCWALAQEVDQGFLVRSIVSHVLTELFRLGDATDLDRVRRNYEFMIARFQQPGAGAGLATDDERAEIVERHRLELEELPARTERQYRRYVEFCERVVRPLALEPEPDIRSHIEHMRTLPPKRREEE
jgi:hypothetical protein